MPVAGAKQTARLTVDPFDTDTVATLAVLSPTGTASAPPVEFVDTRAAWQSVDPITYTGPGEWLLRWTVTGTGAGATDQRVPVAPVPAHAGRTYATTADLATYMDAAPPVGAHRQLVKATREIDKLLVAAVYDVTGADEMPSDTAHREAVRLATCALVVWWAQIGDEYGAAGAITSANIGGVSISIGRGGGGSTQVSIDTRFGPEVFTILRDAGLLGHDPLQW